jgi:hypothetical protein
MGLVKRVTWVAVRGLASLVADTLVAAGFVTVAFLLLMLLIRDFFSIAGSLIFALDLNAREYSSRIAKAPTYMARSKC